MFQQKLNLAQPAAGKMAQSSTGSSQVVRCFSMPAGCLDDLPDRFGRHDDAVTVFLDANALDGPDVQHSGAEARFRRLGRAADGRVLMVAYTLRRNGDAEAIRLISARRASRRERAAYHAKD